jgi:hypothetical protein
MDKEIIKDNDNDIYDQIFSVKEKPKISLSNYIFRINKYLDLEISTWILMLIYIKRISLYGIFINDYNKFKLLIIAINLAIKFNEDEPPSISFIAKVGGISLEEMYKLEEIFLLKINFNLWVSNYEFENYCLINISESQYESELVTEYKS